MVVCILFRHLHAHMSAYYCTIFLILPAYQIDQLIQLSHCHDESRHCPSATCSVVWDILCTLGTERELLDWKITSSIYPTSHSQHWTQGTHIELKVLKEELLHHQSLNYSSCNNPIEREESFCWCVLSTNKYLVFLSALVFTSPAIAAFNWLTILGHFVKESKLFWRVLGHACNKISPTILISL